MWSIYTVEYYASISKDEYPTFVATWTRLKEIMLSEIILTFCSFALLFPRNGTENRGTVLASLGGTSSTEGDWLPSTVGR